MSGLLNQSSDVIKTMAAGSDYLPVSFNKDGTPSKSASIVSPSDFDRIKNYVYDSLIDMGRNLTAGDIRVNPRDAGDSPACKYCDYHSICRIEGDDAVVKAEKCPVNDALGAMNRDL